MADLAAVIENHVLGKYARGELVFPLNAEAFGNLEPDLAGGDDAEHLGRADAGAERAESACHAGVGVGADDEGAGLVIAALGQNLMTRSCVLVVGHLVLLGPVAREADGLSLLYLAGRSVVVAYDNDLGLVPDVNTQLFQTGCDLDSGAEYIVHHGHVDVRHDDFAYINIIFACCSCQSFLCKCHSHSKYNPSLFF